MNVSAPAVRPDPTAGAAPVSAAEAETLFAALEPASGIVVAVSGGPDSTALMALIAQWCRKTGRPPIVAATVDHALRPSSRVEAEAVGRAAADLGLPHRILTWDGAKPTSGLQEAARDARYRVLTSLAKDVGATHLVTAHTRDDQAETALIRLAGGTGLAGLAAMRPAVARDDIVHLRPLLSVSKARLVATCHAVGAFYIHDPSNDDTRFARVRWRHLMPMLAAEGLTADRLIALSERAARIEDALVRQGRHLLEASPGGADGLIIKAWAEAPFEIALRAFGALLARHGVTPAGPDGPRLRRMEACLSALLAGLTGGIPVRRTLAGLVVMLDTDGRLAIDAEGPRRRGHRKPSSQPDACDGAAPLARVVANHKLEIAGAGGRTASAAASLTGRDT